MKKSLRLMTYMLIFVFLVTGCGSKVVATINGEKITEDTLNARLEQMAAFYGYDLNSEEGKSIKTFLQGQVLETMIQEKVILQAAKKEKVSYDKKALNEELKKTRESFESKKKYQEYLNKYKLSEKDLKEMIYRSMLIEKLFQEKTKDITKGTGDAQAYYNENPDEFKVPVQVKVRHILVKTEEEAQDILAALKNGEDFVKLVKEKSIDPSAKQNEGLFDYFTEDVNFVDEFKDAAFAMKKVGEYTKTPVKTVHGYHIIKLEGRQEEKQLTFDEAKQDIENGFLLEEKNAKFGAYVNELMEQAKIERKLSETEGEEGLDEEGLNEEGLAEDGELELDTGEEELESSAE